MIIWGLKFDEYGYTVQEKLMEILLLRMNVALTSLGVMNESHPGATFYESVGYKN